MFIYSRISDLDLRILATTNKVGNMYELIGIYLSYREYFPDTNTDFESYYLEKTGTTLYHFKGKGERYIKEKLYSKDLDVSRREIRLLSRTYWQIPVITSSNMGKILDQIASSILEISEMRVVLCKHILSGGKDSPLNVLYFQYDFLSRYIGYVESRKKKEIFEALINEWELNPIIDNLL